MMARSFACALAATALATTLAACSSSVAVRPDYVAAGVAAPVIDGRVVLVMDEAFRNQVIKANPTSMTGAATTLSAPVGPIVATVGEKIFDAGISGGAEVAPAAQPDAYSIAVRLDSYSYMYDQLSNLGFAITPKITIALKAEAMGPNAKPLLQKTYTRSNFTSGTYVASLQPAEKVNQSLHLALGEIFREMLDDMKAAASQ